MTKHDCEICQGRGTIRLPIYRRAKLAVSISAASVIDESSRQYPCPECSETVPYARVGIVGALQSIDTRIDDPKYINHVKDACAHSLVDKIINGGYLKVESGPVDDKEMRQAFRITLGVVSQQQIATLEERVAKQQIDIAREVATEAAALINNWGSYYGHADILKGDAIQFIDDAIKTVLARRAAWRPSPIAERSRR
jgi:hypothetical protein